MADPLPLYVLAGGRSRRFGSDKARALVDGRPMLVRIVAALCPPADAGFAVAAETGAYADLGVDSIGDLAPGLGPIGGLETALLHRTRTLGAGWILIASCDLTQPSAALVAPLLEARTASGDHAAIAYRHEFWEPLLALYHTRSLPTVREQIQREERAMHRLLTRVGLPVPLPPGIDGIAQRNTPP